MKQLALVMVLALAACAQPGNMAATIEGGEAAFVGSPLQSRVEIEAVEGGRDVNILLMPGVGTEEFAAALLESLQTAGLASADIGRFQLSATIEELNQPPIGAGLTVTSVVRYVIVDQLNDQTIFDELIESSYRASFGDSLVYLDRLRLANEGAIRANIADFLQRLADTPIETMTS